MMISTATKLTDSATLESGSRRALASVDWETFDKKRKGRKEEMIKGKGKLASEGSVRKIPPSAESTPRGSSICHHVPIEACKSLNIPVNPVSGRSCKKATIIVSRYVPIM